MVRQITVVPYDPAWVDAFRREAERLVALLGAELVAIHHIGSTSVPGLAAKPIVDILVEVRRIEAMDALAPQLEVQGYLPKGENGIPGRRYFIKGTEEVRSHHIHIFQVGNGEVARHLALRDYLRAHSEEAARYGALKAELAQHFPADAANYVAGKDALVKELERRALAWAGLGTKPKD